MKCLENLRPLYNLVPQLIAGQTDHAQVYCVSDKSVVIHKFVACKGADSVQKEYCRLFEIPNGDAVRPLIDFQSVSPVPVSALFDQAAKQKQIKNK